ncbi:hypothetical protein EVAR_33858_1 [Eumeta japonica]|uniref:Mos1 transposase HTH domain-containing protein n=1 Tax=Eumeta variegata TaxID=151549 RepID=A0A4C1X447_EUMVA|nr:hypothetical protein EVAR_33858_1 [Eumeta japonica]
MNIKYWACLLNLDKPTLFRTQYVFMETVKLDDDISPFHFRVFDLSSIEKLDVEEENDATQQSLVRLRTAFGDEAPCKMTIYHWFAEFKRGRVNVSDEFRHGRPSIVAVNNNIDAVQRMIETDSM